MFRAYTIQNGLPVYGEVLSFTTAFEQAKVNPSAVTNIGYNTATLNASVASVGSPGITEKGFCYSSTYHRPMVSYNRIMVNSVAGGNYKYHLSGLEEDTNYYVRTHVIQDGDVKYGYTVSFTTYYEPIVVTRPGVEQNNVVINQGAFVDRKPGVREYGFVYSEYANPTVGNATKVQSQNLAERERGVLLHQDTYRIANLSYILLQSLC